MSKEGKARPPLDISTWVLQWSYPPSTVPCGQLDHIPSKVGRMCAG